MARTEILLDVWGCRGSRSLPVGSSAIGNLTSCYSLAAETAILVFDAGRGLTSFSEELLGGRFGTVRDVHILISHAHMDHWEGLKDASWLWRGKTGLSLTIYSSREALAAIRSAHEPPSFVPLDILSSASLEQLQVVEIEARQTLSVGPFQVETRALNHYSGAGTERRYLDTLGFRAAVAGGPVVAYVCDHEPTAATAAVEEELTGDAAAAIYDTHWADRSEQTFGHGSHEHAADMARRFPHTLFLAAHHGAAASDAMIEGAWKRHGAGLANYRIAREGEGYRWRRNKGFEPRS